MKFKQIFKPIYIKKLKIPNKIVFPPINTNYGDSEGFVTKRLINFYDKISKSGVGLCIIGATAIRRDGKVTNNMLMLDEDKYIKGLKNLFDIIRKNNTISSIQLIHAGRQTSKEITGKTPIAPSPLPCPVMKENPNELSIKEIKEIQNSFADAAYRAKYAGADMIELHAAHGYLINEFLSNYSNKRKDEYGGDINNRTRFLREMIQMIKKRVGNSFPLCCRISAVEFVKDGLTMDESKRIAKILSNSGIHLLSISAGVYESMDKICPTKEMGKNVYVNLSKKIKDSINIPVITVGNILDLDSAEKILENNEADMVAMGRALIADPLLILKTKNGNQDKINKCLQCRGCMFWTNGESSMSCKINKNL